MTAGKFKYWMPMFLLHATSAAPPHEMPRLVNGEPVLRMPFPAGAVVLCLQGNQSPPGYSHSTPNCLHALDFSNPAGQAGQIVAAADGTVAYVFAGADPADRLAGLGFGNHVRIDHGGGYFTMYSHLETVTVRTGDRVQAGHPLGTMGKTGNTTEPHLHFSMHRGDPATGPPPTVPIHALIAADVSVSTDVQLYTSLELIAEAGQGAAAGHLYGSENAPGTMPRCGPADEALAARFRHAAEQLLLAKGQQPNRFLTQDIIRQMNVKGPQWTHDRLQEVVSTRADDFEAWYWIGVTAHTSLQNPDEARQAFARILAANPVAPSWLLPWTHLRLGLIAEKDGRNAEAIAAFEKALTYPEDGSGFEPIARDRLTVLRQQQ